MKPKNLQSQISLADMSREDFEKLANERGIGGLDLIQSRSKGQEYLDDLSQIGKDTDYLGPTREELAAGINLGDLTGDVWSGGQGLKEMESPQYENYIGQVERVRDQHNRQIMDLYNQGLTLEEAKNAVSRMGVGGS